METGWVHANLITIPISFDRCNATLVHASSPGHSAPVPLVARGSKALVVN